MSCPCCFDHNLRCCASRVFNSTLLFIAFVVLRASSLLFLEEVNLPVISWTLLTVFLSLVGLQQPKVCGHVIVKPLEENMFLSEPNDVVRTLQPVRVSSFQGRVDKLVRHYSSNVTLDFVHQQVEGATQHFSCLPWHCGLFLSVQLPQLHTVSA